MSSFRTLTAQGIRPLALPDNAQVASVTADINWTDAGAGIAISDVVQIADIPAGFELIDWTFITEDIDSNGTPTVAFTLGSLNAGKTAISTAYTAAGGITAGQAGGQNAPSGATAAACFTEGRSAARSIGLVATAATATAALAGKRACVVLKLRAGAY
jgi:hypothetical protein